MKALQELGSRVRRERISQGLKQRELAEKAAISLNAIASLEHGRPVTTATLSRVLDALGFQDALVNLLPPPVMSPLDLQKLAGKERQRVR